MSLKPNFPLFIMSILTIGHPGHKNFEILTQILSKCLFPKSALWRARQIPQSGRLQELQKILSLAKGIPTVNKKHLLFHG